MANASTIIYCNCSYYDIVSEDDKRKILSSLESEGISFEAVADLCKLAANKDTILKNWAAADKIKIIACFPRAVKWLFDWANAPLPEKNIEFFNMRTESAESIVSKLLQDENCYKGKQNINLKKTGDWVPWFPVIDYDRCENCGQCLNFCLFGVYESDKENKVRVVNPAGCKTNCPACARACPQKAIIFPKYSDCPINGDQVKDSNEKIQLAELVDGDIYEKIRNRGKEHKRFSKNADESNIIELGKKLGIPPEVFKSLSVTELAGIKEKLEKHKGD